MLHQRHADLNSIEQCREDRIDLKGRIREEHLVARIDIGHEQLLQKAARTTADRHARRIDIEPRSDRKPDVGGVVIGVSIDSRDRLCDCTSDFRHGRPGVLVRGQLDCIVDVVFDLDLTRCLAG